MNYFNWPILLRELRKIEQNPHMHSQNEMAKMCGLAADGITELQSRLAAEQADHQHSVEAAARALTTLESEMRPQLPQPSLMYVTNASTGGGL